MSRLRRIPMSGAPDAAVSGRASPVGTRGRFGAPKRPVLPPRSRRGSTGVLARPPLYWHCRRPQMITEEPAWETCANASKDNPAASVGAYRGSVALSCGSGAQAGVLRL
jgi:hypothetical protein